MAARVEKLILARLEKVRGGVQVTPARSAA
jgi:hypothetical protein